MTSKLQRDVPISLVRWFVPWVVATLGPWCARELGVTDEQLSQVATVAIAAAWYLLARLLEYVSPRFGWLLGIPRAPEYGKHEAGRPDDGGYIRPGAAAAVSAATLLILAGTFLLAAQAAAHRSVEHIHVTYSRYCDGGLWVQYDRERLSSGAWEPAQDDGTVRVELHHLGAAAGPGGGWVPLPEGLVLQRAGNYVMVDVRGLRVWDQVRVAYPTGRGGWVASSPALQPKVVCVWVGRSGEPEAAVKP